SVVEGLGDVGSNRVHTVVVLAPAPVVSEDVVEHHVRHGVSSPLGDLDTSMVPAPRPTAWGLCYVPALARAPVRRIQTRPQPKSYASDLGSSERKSELRSSGPPAVWMTSVPT